MTDVSYLWRAAELTSHGLRRQDASDNPIVVVSCSQRTEIMPEATPGLRSFLRLPAEVHVVRVKLLVGRSLFVKVSLGDHYTAYFL
jgi:hypothetical protein